MNKLFITKCNNIDNMWSIVYQWVLHPCIPCPGTYWIIWLLAKLQEDTAEVKVLPLEGVAQ